MKILVIGSGGREHAIAWRLSLEGHQIFGAPGNPGIAQVGTIFASTEYLALAESLRPDLTVVGPEVPLVAGVVDQFRAHGLAIVGPTQENAQLEGSKIFAKEFMQRTGIPTARFVRTETPEAAIAALSMPIISVQEGVLILPLIGTLDDQRAETLTANLLVEIQQNSDTTYRVFDWNRLGDNGQPRQLHIEQSLECIDFADFEPALGKCDSETLVTCDWFSVDRWVLNQARQANSEPKFSIFQVVAGTVSFGAQFFRRGDLFLVPAGCHQAAVTPQDAAATVLRTTL